MGEIKSTLDIIMEKTQGLTMTAEEKREFKRKEAEKKVRGFLQKFLDGLMDLDQLHIEMSALDKDEYGAGRKALAKACIDRMEVRTDNEIFLSVLRDVVGIDPEPFRKISEEYQRNLEREKGIREDEMKKDLKKSGISGSAVTANINADPTWVQYAREAEATFHKKLNSIQMT